MDTLSQQSERLAALGHPIRLSILRHIVQGEQAGTPAGEIQQALGIPASTLSHHLSTLSAAQLVGVERQGTTLRYRADFDTLRALIAFILEDCCRRDSGKEACCLPAAAENLPAGPGPEPRPVQPHDRATAWNPDFD